MTTKITRWQDRPWDSPWVDEPWTTTMAATITEIGIGRDMCYGSCPVYALSLERSGIARFHGHSFVDMDGAHLAQIDPQDFALLALAIEHLGFAALEPGYRSNITCLSTTTTWVRRGDVRQEVDAYGWRPEALGVIEDLIDSAASELTWRSNGGRPAISVGMRAGDVDPGDRTHWTQRRHGGRLQWLVEATLDEAGLTGRERKVLELRFGLEDGRPRTVAEVATVLGVSAARIRQIEAKALKALRGSRGPAGGG